MKELLETLTGGDDDGAEAVIPALVACGSAALQALGSLWQSLATLEGAEGTDLRWWVLRALGAFPDSQALDYLLAGLHDSQPAIRQCAALGLRQAAERGADPWIIPALTAALEDTDSLCVTLAADSLIVIGSAAVPPLLEMAEVASPAAYPEVMRCLALIADPRALPALSRALASDAPISRYWAGEGLKRMQVSSFKPE